MRVLFLGLSERARRSLADRVKLRLWPKDNMHSFLG
jgi:hypothetical protein